MKKLLISFILLSITIGTFAQNQNGIQFEHTSWQKVLEKAKTENKLIFVDAYATWCGPCKFMSKNIFTNPSVGEFYNSNFVNFKIDMESDAGKSFNLVYSISSYPSLMFIDGNGKIVKKQEGASSTPNDFIKLGDYVLHPEKSPVFISQKKYKEGARERKFLVEYFIVLATNGEDPTFIMEEYNKLYKPTSLKIEEDLFMYCFNSNNSDFDNELTKEFVKNSKQYAKSKLLIQYNLHTEKVKEIINFNLQKSIENKDDTLLEKVIIFFKDSFGNQLEEKEIKKTEKEFRKFYQKATRK